MTPLEEMLDADGTALWDADYSPFVSFDTITARQRFNTAIIAAVQKDRLLEDAGMPA